MLMQIAIPLVMTMVLTIFDMFETNVFSMLLINDSATKDLKLTNLAKHGRHLADGQTAYRDA